MNTPTQEKETVIRTEKVVDAYVELFSLKQEGLITPETFEAYQYVFENGTSEQITALFTPPDATDEEVVAFSEAHLAIYEQEAARLVQDGLVGPGRSLTLEGGMCAGKSTLAILLSRSLEEKGVKTVILTATALGHPHISPRAFRPNKFEAIMFDLPNLFEVVLQILEEAENAPEGFVVILDEFTFIDLNALHHLWRTLNERGIGLIQMGLDTNYLGVPLPPFKEVKRRRWPMVKCYAFTPGEDISEGPRAEMTARYVRLPGSGIWIADFGLAIGVLVDGTPGIKYGPATWENHVTGMLHDRRDLLTRIQAHESNPQQRILFTERLKEQAEELQDDLPR